MCSSLTSENHFVKNSVWTCSKLWTYDNISSSYDCRPQSDPENASINTWQNWASDSDCVSKEWESWKLCQWESREKKVRVRRYVDGNPRSFVGSQVNWPLTFYPHVLVVAWTIWKRQALKDLVNLELKEGLDFPSRMMIIAAVKREVREMMRFRGRSSFPRASHENGITTIHDMILQSESIENRIISWCNFSALTE